LEAVVAYAALLVMLVIEDLYLPALFDFPEFEAPVGAAAVLMIDLPAQVANFPPTCLAQF
jgi:hypothetical protein